MRLLDETIRRAPGQEVAVSQGSCKTRPLKRYIALDAEFKKVKSTEPLEEIEDASDRAERDAGDPEDLCSILTVAVDRQLVFSFYLLDMLEHPTETTVEEVRSVFQVIICTTALY